MEILICTDSASSLIRTNEKVFSLIKTFSPILDKIENEVQIRFDNKFVENLQIDIVETIKIKLPKLQVSRDPYVSYSKYEFEGKEIKLNLRNSGEFNIATLIGLNLIIEEALSRKGTLFIYNQTLLDGKAHSNIVPVIKTHINTISKIELMTSINKLAKEFESVKKISSSQLNSSLEYLRSIGLIDYKDDQNINLTAKGFMISL